MDLETLARAGIGAAESCLVPARWSLLADYFNEQKLPRAMSVVLIGPFVGSGLALVLGGLVMKHVAVGAGIHGERVRQSAPAGGGRGAAERNA